MDLIQADAARSVGADAERRGTAVSGASQETSRVEGGNGGPTVLQDVANSRGHSRGKADKASVVIPFSIILPSIAVLLSGAALAWAVLKDPLGKGIKAYDFSTPKAALMSQLKIEKDGDIRAVLQLSGLLKEGSRLQEKLR